MSDPRTEWDKAEAEREARPLSLTADQILQQVWRERRAPFGTTDLETLCQEIERLRAENATLRHDIACYQGPTDD